MAMPSPNPDPSSTASSIRDLTKLTTHIPGLDRIFRGGLPEGRMTTLTGGPGSGKTMLALEILYRSVQSGKPGIFVSFEENDSLIRGNALSLGWDLAALEDAGQLAVIHPVIDHKVLKSGDFNIEAMVAVLAGKAQEIGARCIVIDGMDMLLRYFEEPQRQHDEFLLLYEWLQTRKMTSILTVKLQQSFQVVEKYEFLDYLADCLIYLDQRVTGQVMTRRMRIIKYRGSGYSSNEHPFIITPEGCVLMPVTATALTHKALGAAVPAGLDQLDRILGGGYRQGSSVLISGPTGSGKTSFASLFAQTACRRGDRVQYVSFEESPETLMEGMRSMKIDLAPHVQDGTLRFLTAMPEALGVEEHLYRIFRSMDAFQPTHHIVDAVSAAVRMGSEKAAFDFMVRLMDECKGRGITCIYTNQTSSRTPVDEISGIGISSLIDTAVVLDYDRRGDEFGRSLLVLKSRGASHSHRIHPFRMSSDGLLLVEPDSGPASEGGEG